jgi:hypothetical protein
MKIKKILKKILIHEIVFSTIFFIIIKKEIKNKNRSKFTTNKSKKFQLKKFI